MLLGNDTINSIIDINSVNLQLQTPLHIAIERRNLSIIEALLENKSKIKINERDNKGNTPFNSLIVSLISQKNNTTEDSIYFKIAFLLIEHLADLTIKNYKNHTPYQLLNVNYEYQSKIGNYMSKIKEKILDVCFLCKENKRSVLLKPCNHIISCNLCSSKIMECLLCNKFITAYVNVEECLICFEKRANVLFEPCDHMIACYDCFNKLNLKKCLKCRANIETHKSFSENFIDNSQNSTHLQNDLQEIKEKVKNLKLY